MLSSEAAAVAEHFRLCEAQVFSFVLGTWEALAALVAWIAYLCCPWMGLALVGETLVLAALVAFVRAWWCHRRLVALEGVL